VQSLSSMHVSPGVWQKYSVEVGKNPLPLGEQYPHGPQSESMRHPLPVAQTLGVTSVADARQMQATFPEQSESV